MLGPTLRYKSRRIHIAQHLLEIVCCPDVGTHTMLDWEGLQFVEPLLETARGDAIALAELRRLIAIVGDARDVHRVSDVHVIRYVAELLKTGRLQAVTCGLDIARPATAAGSGVGGHEQVQPDKQTTPPRERKPVTDATKTWIEIRLLDEQGRPVPNERYQLRLPDDSLHEGTLDENGRARYEEIDPGTCTVCFPDIDKREWRPA